MPILAIVPDDGEDVVDQLGLLHHHVGEVGGEVDADDRPQRWQEIRHVAAIDAVHRNIFRHLSPRNSFYRYFIIEPSCLKRSYNLSSFLLEEEKKRPNKYLSLKDLNMNMRNHNLQSQHQQAIF